MVSRLELATAWSEVVLHDRAGFELPDPIGFADGGPGGAAWRGGPWAACGRVAVMVPVARAGGGCRMLAVLDPGVHALYRALVARVAPSVERGLGPSVTANRCRPPRRGPGLRLEPWRRARRRHVRLVRALATSGGDGGRRLEGPFLRADVRDCYASIAPAAVTDALRQSEARPEDGAQLEGLLRRFQDDGIPGLPVGPEPSAVLANAVLSAVDRALAREGVASVRWVDDVLARPRGDDWVGALEAFRSGLAEVGLHAAEPKCGPAGLGALADPGRSGPRATPCRPRDGSPAGTHGDDPFEMRAVVARRALEGTRESRAYLRHVRRRQPELRATVEWGLAR